MNSFTIDSARVGSATMDLAKRLFPIHRTLVNTGYDTSLDILGKELPLVIEKYPSGSKAWDWTIPDAWDVREAWIEDMDGNRIVDFAENNLHLSAYSQPFSGVVSKNELLDHLDSLEEQPDAIPFKYLYYSKDWRFSVTHNDLAKFTDDKYRVLVDVNQRPGELKAATCVIPGKSDKEIVFSTYLCHPSMANDNLSGVVATVGMFKELLGQEFNHTLRLLIIPETVGAICWMANNEPLLPNIIGGYAIYNCGDRANISYKKSYFESDTIDQAAFHAMERRTDPGNIFEWSPHGSDERQFNAPGVRIPFGCVMRSGASNYPEYHTSLDTLDMLSEEALADTVEYLTDTLFILDNDLTFTNNYRAEPFMSQYDIEYPEYTFGKHWGKVNIIKAMLHEFDGSNSLLDITKKWDFRFEDVLSTALAFEKAGLITRLQGNTD